MKISRIFLAPLTLALFACSTSTSAPGGTETEQPTDRGIEGTGETNAASAPDTNPDGVPYPTDNLGTKARSGSTPGNRMMNYKFLGYPNADMSQGLQPISLANFFDPSAKKYKMIHIQASGTWCGYCKQETKTVKPIAQAIADRKVLWIISLAEGKTMGTPATSNDLDQWMAEFKTPFTHVLDSGNKNLGPFYDSAALPWNANIDARTMEILSAGVGAQDHLTEKDALADLDKWLTKIDNNSL